jgi:hypothetical protein
MPRPLDTRPDVLRRDWTRDRMSQTKSHRLHSRVCENLRRSDSRCTFTLTASSQSTATSQRSVCVFAGREGSIAGLGPHTRPRVRSGCQLGTRPQAPVRMDGFDRERCPDSRARDRLHAGSFTCRRLDSPTYPERLRVPSIQLLIVLRAGVQEKTGRQLGPSPSPQLLSRWSATLS